jgi:hypothetical protein
MICVIDVLAAPTIAHAAAAEPTGASKETIALLPLVASRLASDEVESIDRTVNQAVAAHFGERAIPAHIVSERLERGGARGVRCDRTDPTCSAQLGAVCGADLVLVATFSAGARRSTMSVRIVDTTEAIQLAHAAATVGETPTIEEVRALLAALEGAEARITRLDVNGPPGAEVLIDGQVRGALPLPPFVDLDPGMHEIIVEGETTPFRTTLELRRGEPASITAPGAPGLTPKNGARDAAGPTPGTMPLVLVASGGGGALVGLVALGVGLWPLAAAHASAGELAQFQAAAVADESVLRDNAAAIRNAHDSVESNNLAWSQWGLWTALGGGVITTLGVAALGFGLVTWGEEEAP